MAAGGCGGRARSERGEGQRDEREQQAPAAESHRQERGGGEQGSRVKRRKRNERVVQAVQANQQHGGQQDHAFWQEEAEDAAPNGSSHGIERYSGYPPGQLRRERYAVRGRVAVNGRRWRYSAARDAGTGAGRSRLDAPHGALSTLKHGFESRYRYSHGTGPHRLT